MKKTIIISAVVLVSLFIGFGLGIIDTCYAIQHNGETFPIYFAPAPKN